MKNITNSAILAVSLSLVSCSSVSVTDEERALLSSVGVDFSAPTYSALSSVVEQQSSSSGGNTKNFIRQDLKTWSPISTAKINGRPAVKVCVRDHECEDGDILQVFIDGKSFTKELTNASYCKIMPVDAGKIVVGVLAVNGSGHKGNCSYANANTGEIVMHGINSDGSIRNSQTQSWSLRAKAGTKSTAQIIVQ